MSARRFALLDRDGTLIAYKPYLTDPADVALAPGAAEAIRRLRALGFGVAVVTNQSVIGRGRCTEADVAAVHARMHALLVSEGVAVDDVAMCPHAPADGCPCRKPRAGMVDALVGRWGFDPRRAVVIGDNASDMALARAVGALAVLVRTGVGEEALGEGVDCDHVADDLVGAVAWVEGQVA